MDIKSLETWLWEAARNDYNLSPSRYVSINGKKETLPLEEAMVLLREAEEERAEADRALYEILESLGLGVIMVASLEQILEVLQLY